MRTLKATAFRKRILRTSMMKDMEVTSLSAHTIMKENTEQRIKQRRTMFGILVHRITGCPSRFRKG
jgi:hypothetical protein